MAERLRSITKRIPWSLLLRSAIFATLWFLGAPRASGFGAFAFIWLGVALLFYFLPFFRPAALAPHFVALLLAASILPRSFTNALLLALAFGLILGIKDLLLLDRETAYEALVFVLVFCAAYGIYGMFPVLSLPGLGLMVLAAIFFAIFMRRMPWRDAVDTEPEWTVPLVQGLLFLELGITIFLLPLDYFSQSAIFLAFAVAATFFSGKLSAGSALAPKYYAAGFALAAGLVLAFASWGI